MGAIVETVPVAGGEMAVPATGATEHEVVRHPLRVAAAVPDAERDGVPAEPATPARPAPVEAAVERGVAGVERDGGLVSGTSFLRLVDLPFATVAAALEAMWQHGQRGGYVRIGGNALMGRPSIDNGVGRVPVVIRRRRGPASSSLPMDLELASWSDARPVTRLELIAGRRVRATRRYFSAGHDVLDTLIEEARGSARQRLSPRRPSPALAGSG
jgi:hypothetical protein